MNVISFWKKESGNMLSHKTGLSEEQIEFLRSLKAGDRLVLWKGEEGNTSPSFKLKLFKPLPKND